MRAMVSELRVTSVSDGNTAFIEDNAASDTDTPSPTGSERVAWLLLIYTVPSEPSRLRAAIWRDLKRAGATYLRDGVAALPDRAPTRAIFRAVAARIAEFEGQATLVENARLEAPRAAALIAQARAARAEEYGEIAGETERFLTHAAREREHREFTFAEVEEIEVDLGKLRRWAEQVRARDYFGADGATAVDRALGRCEAALASFLEAAYHHDEGAEVSEP